MQKGDGVFKRCRKETNTGEAEVRAGEGHLRKDKVPPLSRARLHAGLQFKFRANVQRLKK